MEFNIGNTAVVGESGSGKSTVLQLILRMYDPDGGTIYVDGYDLRQLDLGWFRDQIGYVGQEPVLFAGTIKDNMLLYSPKADDDMIDQALKEAEIYEFIKKDLPFGLDTYVGIGGKQISGGQKQRIAIARALLKRPKIMIFDEATSALDKRNERNILETLNRLNFKMTSVTVSHRAQVMECSDYVYMFGKGQII